jgi:hypothetical protein
MLRLIKSVLAILIATAFIVAPAVQAAAMPCDTDVTSVPDLQHPSGHDHKSTSCNNKMSTCVDIPGCGLSAGLPGRIAMTTSQAVWTSAAYWPVADLLAGLSVEPNLGPPISI